MQEPCQLGACYNWRMILVTGGTGFIGRALVRHLVESGYAVRTLIRPSRQSPRLPQGISMEVAVAGFDDARSLRAAMLDVDVIYHLAGDERRGAQANLLGVDIQGTRAILDAAVDAGVDRFFMLSHLGANRASAYPVLKAKAIAEEHIRRSGLDYTILRTAAVYGPGDNFTTGLAQLVRAIPFVFPLPHGGETLLQPLWIEDLVTCLIWALDDDGTRGQTYEIGGPEFLSLREIVLDVMHTTRTRRKPVSVHPALLRGLTVVLEYFLPGLPLSIYWFDYLAANRTCSLDTVPRVFNLMPSRFSQRLNYLEGQPWGRRFWRSIFGRRKQ
ncbi:MAG TPA: NAD-dependent epimerase/dehydratase family protein [Anaerolineales bacterium]|nr:NAD-dependent epimerase/dehydratase family protein [Anaerolineales bacterium]